MFCNVRLFFTVVDSTLCGHSSWVVAGNTGWSKQMLKVCLVLRICGGAQSLRCKSALTTQWQYSFFLRSLHAKCRPCRRRASGRTRGRSCRRSCSRPNRSHNDRRCRMVLRTPPVVPFYRQCSSDRHPSPCHTDIELGIHRAQRHNCMTTLTPCLAVAAAAGELRAAPTPSNSSWS